MSQVKETEGETRMMCDVEESSNVRQYDENSEESKDSEDNN